MHLWLLCGFPNMHLNNEIPELMDTDPDVCFDLEMYVGRLMMLLNSNKTCKFPD